MDKQWKSFDDFFIHKVSTGHGHGVRDLLAHFFECKHLIYKGLKKLPTGKGLLNNNNKLTISNIY